MATALDSRRFVETFIPHPPTTMIIILNVELQTKGHISVGSLVGWSLQSSRSLSGLDANKACRSMNSSLILVSSGAQ